MHRQRSGDGGVVFPPFSSVRPVRVESDHVVPACVGVVFLCVGCSLLVRAPHVVVLIVMGGF
jgi:hypothetical protein